MELSRRLLVYRISHDLTQKEMALKLGISHPTLIAIELKRKLTIKTQIKVELKLNELEGK